MNQADRAPRLALVRRIFIAQLCLVAVLCLLIAIGTVWHVGSFFFGVTLGSLGGSIALLRRVRGEEAGMLEEWSADITSTLMPLLFGGLMAGVAYLLFMSGILSGEGGGGLFTSNLFPRFTTPSGEDASLVGRFLEMEPVDMKDVGKLLVWCFVAGYSERFVTGILKQLERRGEGGH